MTIADTLHLSRPCPVCGGSRYGLLMTLTDVAAWVGAAAGIAALLWQAFTRRRSNHNVRVATAHAYPFINGQFGDDMVSVTASNVGAGPVTVTGWGIEVSKQNNIVVTVPVVGSTPLPHRLEQGAEGTWYVSKESLIRTAQDRGIRPGEVKKWRAWVSLGTGQKVSEKDGFPNLN